MKYIPALDGLRAVAVLAVVAYHAGLGVPAGFIGVDVFFVISGYLITSLLARELEATGEIDFVGFYARRVRRILPALLVMIGATVAAACTLLTQGDIARVTRSAMAALGMFANIHFANVTGGYFDQASADMPLLHTWSLSVEEQFYFLWPLVLILRRRWLVPALTVASFLLAQGVHAVDPEVAFFQMPTRFWELGVGGWIALSAPRKVPGLVPASLALLVVALAVPTFAVPAPAVAVLAAAGLIHAVHAGTPIGPLENAPLRFIGRISFSLYLWHWPVLVLYRLTHLNVPTSHALALCMLAIGLAWVSYRFIETPWRRQAGRRRHVLGGLATCAAAILAVLPIAHHADAAAHQLTDYFTPRHGPARVLLWGDSHAGTWAPLAEALARKLGGSVRYDDMAGCPPTLGYAMHVLDAHVPNFWSKCLRHNDDAANGSNGVDTVVMSARWLPLFQQLPGLESPYPTDPVTVQAMTDGLARALAAVAPKVRRVILIGPNPQLKADLDRCAASGEDCAMTRAQFDALAAKPLATLRRLAAPYPNVEVLDPTTFLCDAQRCPVMRDRQSLYRDDDHLSGYATQTFAQQLLH